MAKGSHAPLIGALFDSITPKAQDKKRTRKPKTNKVTLGEKSVTQPHQQHGELASAAEPTPVERVHDHASREKVHATQAWVEGRMTTEEHNRIHSRANHVLGGRHPGSFRGKTGDRKVKW